MASVDHALTLQQMIPVLLSRQTGIRLGSVLLLQVAHLVPELRQAVQL